MASISVVYSLYSVAGGADTTSSSSPCVPPTLGADVSALVYPGFPEIQGKSKEPDDVCKRLCRRWRLNCRSTVRLSRDCFRRYNRRALTLDTAECNTFDNRPDGRPCKQQEQEAFNELANFTRTDTAEARDCCNDYFDICRQQCLGANSSMEPCSELFIEQNG